MFVLNPTDTTLEMSFKGINYTIAPKGKLAVPQDVAEHWQQAVHEFVVLEEEKAVKEVAPVVAPEPTAPLSKAPEAFVPMATTPKTK